MQIGLIDVDNHKKLDKCFPNLPLMKLSAYHKREGDQVEWYKSGKHYAVVYMSKVFSFTPDFDEPIDADFVIMGGTGYAIERNIHGKEVFKSEFHHSLPHEIEHIFPITHFMESKTLLMGLCPGDAQGVAVFVM